MIHLRIRKGYKVMWFLPKMLQGKFHNPKVVPELLRIYTQSTGSVHSYPIYNHPLSILSIYITSIMY